MFSLPSALSFITPQKISRLLHRATIVFIVTDDCGLRKNLTPEVGAAISRLVYRRPRALSGSPCGKGSSFRALAIKP